MTQRDASGQTPQMGEGSLSFDRVATRYDGTRGYPRPVSDAIAEGIIQHGPLPPGASALEIGAGTGRIAIPLLERGVHITGVDISARMLEQLVAKYGEERATHPERPWGALTTRLADGVRLPVESASFDAVIAVHVFHLITNWREALDGAQRALRPGAPLLLGQDMSHNPHISHPLQDTWIDITTDLGFIPERVGAQGFTEILQEVRARGLVVNEWTIANWTASYTPAEAFASIAERTWSLTWQVPDDIFVESIARLETWARSRYGEHWNDPIEATYSFRLARASRTDR